MGDKMEPVSVPARVSLVTLGVADVARSTEFYERLGSPLSSASVPGEVSFFRTAGGPLAVWGAAELAAEMGAAGATIVKGARPTDWGGYQGYFADPDGHVWEIAHNPGWPIGADGRPALP